MTKGECLGWHALSVAKGVESLQEYHALRYVQSVPPKLSSERS
jgi:hypothetical protein